MGLDQFRLDGKVAVVTGAGRGIGAATATMFAEAGAERVFIWPLADEVNQLEIFSSKVAPLVDS